MFPVSVDTRVRRLPVVIYSFIVLHVLALVKRHAPDDKQDCEKAGEGVG